MFVEAIECFHCFFRVRTNRILSIAECRRFFLLLFKMIKSRCVRIRYFRLALVSGGNIGFSMGQKLHFDFMSGGDGQGRVLWLALIRCFLVSVKNTEISVWRCYKVLRKHLTLMLGEVNSLCCVRKW